MKTTDKVEKCLCGEKIRDGTGVCDYCYAEILEEIWGKPVLLEEVKKYKKKYIGGLNEDSLK